MNKPAPILAGLLVLGGSATSAAAPAWIDLVLKEAPARVRMKMRTAAAAPAATTAKAVKKKAAKPATAPVAPELAKQVIFRFDLGLQIDGAGVTGEPTLAGGTLEGQRYDAVRGTGFGDLYLGSRGLLLPSLSTYFAAHARFAAAPAAIVPIATVYDNTRDLEIRSGWAESTGWSRHPALRPLRVRAGRQFAYGPAIAHFDGVVVAWETPALDLRAYTGTRVPDYWPSDRGDAPPREGLAGAELRIDLAAATKIPVVLAASALRFADHRHGEISLAYARRNKNVVVRALARTLDEDWARQHATVRVQVSDVTQLRIDVDHRSRDDWRWDFAWVDADQSTAARRYLDLGAVSPRLTTSVRAGTVVLGNIDVLARFAAAIDRSSPTDRRSPSSRGWLEAGGAFEVRLRRALGLGASALVRDYDRPTAAPILDTEAGPTDTMGQPFPSDPTLLGEARFVEAGAQLRFSAGARRFSATAETFFRRTRMVEVYVDDDPAVGGDEPIRDALLQHGGGRFALEAWPWPRLRLRAEYDLTTVFEVAPEIRGYKSLRVLAEGSF